MTARAQEWLNQHVGRRTQQCITGAAVAIPVCLWLWVWWPGALVVGVLALAVGLA